MIKIKINGIVQGVGFRPFIFRLATEMNLKGYVLNSSAGVEIEAIGENLETFLKRIQNEAPPASQIKEISYQFTEDKIYENFTIKKSENKDGITLISPDLAVCEDCINEFNNPKDPRYNYAFINCTNCGPRYSIIENTPYDRPKTTMKTFEMCDYCKSEYENPLDRRFHAQPIACPKCGPQLKLVDNDFNEITGNPIFQTIELLKKGNIIGIKGIGGFHICCDATNSNVITELRKRKNRPHKPFAIMCKAKNLAEIVEFEEKHLKLLKSPIAPIVVLPKKANKLSQNVAPQNPNLGVFLPYAPQHYQILSDNLPFIIMTSGNLNNEPIAADEKELGKLCDYYLTHNRPIINRSDDSIIIPTKKHQILARRSRGFVPSPQKIPLQTVPTLACGAELKLTFSISENETIYTSPYLGNSATKRTQQFYRETVENFQKWFRIQPELAVCDLQPDFASTQFAEKLNLPLVRVQHHHAHIAAVMAEHNLNEKVIGIAYDGTGYGTDGKIWGGEILVNNYTNFERKFHLNYMPLVGGDAAIRKPVRIAFAYLKKIGENTDFLKDISEMEKNVISKQLETHFNVFETSSIGRLFDCVATMLGLFPTISFEAQSAMALEFLCECELLENAKIYPFKVENKIIDIRPILKAISTDIKNGENSKNIAKAFHKTIIHFTLDAIQQIHAKTNINKVVLAGGVMQNSILLDGISELLSKNNFTVFAPQNLPSNDGSISVGQILIGNTKKGVL